MVRADRERFLRWWVCETDEKTACLYLQPKPRPDGRARCIKHGSILNPAVWLNGLSRTEARKRLSEHLVEATFP